MYIKIKIVYNNSSRLLKANKANGCSCEQVFGYIPNTGRGVEVYL
jgi:hypothetical protein